MKKPIIPGLILVFGISLLYPLQRWMDTSMPRGVVSEESLYFASGEKIKRMSLGLESIVADVYWIRTIQYFGRKFIESGQPISMNSTKNIEMELLAPLLDIVVKLDPHNIPAYRFGAIFLPERDMPAAVNLLERGIKENPQAWRLYQDMGFICWQAGDYAQAADWYERGGQIEGAYWWMRDLAGIMRIQGGSREMAWEIYSKYAESEDPKIRQQAIGRLKQLRALADLDIINALLAEYKQQRGSCPENLKPFAARLQASQVNLNKEGLPVDSEGFAYSLDTTNCKAEIAVESPIPR
jgi:tetratricopeptide (TPR) repeat protein